MTRQEKKILSAAKILYEYYNNLGRNNFPFGYDPFCDRMMNGINWTIQHLSKEVKGVSKPPGQ